MGRQEVLLILLGIALGASLIMAAWVGYLVTSPNQVHGSTVDTQGVWSVASCRMQGRGDAEAFWVFDHEQKKLAVYLMNGKNFEVLAVRDLQYDFNIPAFSAQGGRQTPDIKQMRDMKRK